MKKLLILILIALLLTLSIFLVVNGLQVGNVELLGITEIKEKNAELDEKIQEATKLASTDYEKTISTLNSDAKKLEEQKKSYDDMVAVSSDSDVQSAAQLQQYEVETLWVKLGRHATSEGAVIKMDISKGSNSTEGSSTYNLKFTVNGSYISITDFISSIENDSELGFKVEEFKMVPSSSGTDLEATFVCKDIAIKGVTESTTSSRNNGTTDDKNATNNTTDNTVNNTTNSATSNTINNETNTNNNTNTAR